MAFLVIFLNLLSQGLSVGASFWLAQWSTEEDRSPDSAKAKTYVLHVRMYICTVPACMYVLLYSVCMYNMCIVY